MIGAETEADVFCVFEHENVFAEAETTDDVLDKDAARNELFGVYYSCCVPSLPCGILCFMFIHVLSIESCPLQYYVRYVFLVADICVQGSRSWGLNIEASRRLS